MWPGHPGGLFIHSEHQHRPPAHSSGGAPWPTLTGAVLVLIRDTSCVLNSTCACGFDKAFPVVLILKGIARSKTSVVHHLKREDGNTFFKTGIITMVSSMDTTDFSKTSSIKVCFSSMTECNICWQAVQQAWLNETDSRPTGCEKDANNVQQASLDSACSQVVTSCQ